MSQVARAQAVIDLVVDDEGVAKKVQDSINNAKRLAGKNGIRFKVGVDESNIASVQKELINLINGNNDIVLSFDKNAFFKSFDSIDAEGMKRVEAFAQKIQDMLNSILTSNPNLGKGVLNADAESKEIKKVTDEINNQKAELAQLEKEKNKYNKIQKKSAEAIQDAYTKSKNGGRITSKERFLRQYAARDELGLGDIEFDYEDRRGKKSKVTSAELSDYFQELINQDSLEDYDGYDPKELAKAFKEIGKTNNLDSYKNIISQIDERIKKIQELENKIEELKEKFKQEPKKNSEETHHYEETKEENKEEEKSDKNNGAKKSSGSSGKNNSNGGGTPPTNGDGGDGGGNNPPVKENIEPNNLEEFYQKIEQYRNAKITVVPDELDEFFNTIEASKNKAKVEIVPDKLDEFYSTIESSDNKEKVKVDVESSNLEEFYKAIEEYRNANINIEPTGIEEFYKAIESLKGADIKLDVEKLEQLFEKEKEEKEEDEKGKKSGTYKKEDEKPHFSPNHTEELTEKPKTQSSNKKDVVVEKPSAEESKNKEKKYEISKDDQKIYDRINKYIKSFKKLKTKDVRENMAKLLKDSMVRGTPLNEDEVNKLIAYKKVSDTRNNGSKIDIPTLTRQMAKITNRKDILEPNGFDNIFPGYKYLKDIYDSVDFRLGENKRIDNEEKLKKKHQEELAKKAQEELELQRQQEEFIRKQQEEHGRQNQNDEPKLEFHAEIDEESKDSVKEEASELQREIQEEVNSPVQSIDSSKRESLSAIENSPINKDEEFYRDIQSQIDSYKKMSKDEILDKISSLLALSGSKKSLGDNKSKFTAMAEAYKEKRGDNASSELLIESQIDLMKRNKANDIKDEWKKTLKKFDSAKKKYGNKPNGDELKVTPVHNELKEELQTEQHKKIEDGNQKPLRIPAQLSDDTIQKIVEQLKSINVTDPIDIPVQISEDSKEKIKTELNSIVVEKPINVPIDLDENSLANIEEQLNSISLNQQLNIPVNVEEESINKLIEQIKSIKLDNPLDISVQASEESISRIIEQLDSINDKINNKSLEAPLSIAKESVSNVIEQLKTITTELKADDSLSIEYKVKVAQESIESLLETLSGLKSNIESNNSLELQYKTDISEDSIDSALTKIGGLKQKIIDSISSIDIEFHPVNLNDITNLIDEQKQMMSMPRRSTSGAEYAEEEASLRQIVELQKTVKKGERNLAKNVDGKNKKVNNPLISKEDITSNGLSVYKESVEKVLKEFNDNKEDKNLKDKLITYVGAYKNIDKLKNSVFKDYPKLWNEISKSVEKATASQEAYNNILKVSEKLKGEKLTDEDKQVISNSSNSKNLKEILKDRFEIGSVDIETLKDSVSSLIGEIGKIGESYNKSVSDVSSGAETQIAKVKEVKNAVDSLSQDLENIGVKTLEEMPNYKSQMKQLQETKQELDKQMEAYKKMKADFEKMTASQTATDKLKNAFKGVDNWALDTSSITETEDGMTRFFASFKNANGEIQKFKFSVGDLDKVLTKSGNIKNSFLNKGELVKGDSTEKAIDDITKLKNMSSKTIGFNLDESSITKLDNGMLTFKADVAQTNGELKTLYYTIQDFSKIANKKNGAFTETFIKSGKTEEKLAIEKAKKVNENIKNKREQDIARLTDAASNTNGFVLDSAKFDSNGILQFTAYVEDADGKVQKLSTSVKELSLILTKGGLINKNALDIGNVTKIEELLGEYKNQTKQNKLDDVFGVDNTNGLQRAEQLEIQINNLINNQNVSLEKQKSILSEIASIKAEEAEYYNIYDEKNVSARNKLQNSLNDYKNTLENVDYTENKNTSYENLEGNLKYYDKLSGKVITVREKMEQLKETADQLQDMLVSGKFDNKDAFEKIKQQFQDLMAEMNSIYNNPAYQKINKYGEKFLENAFDGKKLKELTNNEVERYLNKKLEKDSSKVIEKAKYNPKNNTARAKVVKDGNVENVSFRLSEKDAKNADKASISIHKLYQTEGEYLSTGEKWINNIKGKVASLTQYVTGLSLVMGAFNRFREGFAFVREFDSSLTTINQTMNVSTSQLQKLGSSSISLGKQLGASAQDVLGAVSIYANANETANSILEKAQPTVMLSNASGGDVSEASDQVQAVTQQFDELEGQERRIVNSYEKISSNVAIDFKKGIGVIAEGTQNAGSVAKESGMQFEQFASSVAKVAEKTRQDGM